MYLDRRCKRSGYLGGKCRGIWGGTGIHVFYWDIVYSQKSGRAKGSRLWRIETADVCITLAKEPHVGTVHIEGSQVVLRY